MSDPRYDGLTAPTDPAVITRRDAIQRVTVLLGGFALVGGNALLTACSTDRAAIPTDGTSLFNAHHIALLDEIADTILPDTDSPGAKAAAVGPFIAHMVTATYQESDQQVFRDGLDRVEEASHERFGSSFVDATPEQRLELVEALDREQKSYMDSRQAARDARRDAAAQADSTGLDDSMEAMTGLEPSGVVAITADAPSHYFRMMKELTLLGYFTSEIGYNQAMRYVESPGRFDPCLPHAPGEKIWAPHA